MDRRLAMVIVAMALVGAAVAGCGSGSSAEGPQTTSAAETGQAGSGGGASESGAKESGGATESGGGKEAGTGGAAVPSEAESLATGDIPDNQEFLTFKDGPAGYSIKYPAGWARTGNGNEVTFREKGNLIHLVVRSGAAKNATGEKKSFTRQSAPDPVTGKRVPLMVDVYEYAKGGKVAVLELSTPEGVDNVDAYRMISESFQWR